MMEKLSDAQAGGIKRLRVGKQLVDYLAVTLFKSIDYLFGSVGVAFVHVVGNLDKGVGCARHCRQHDDVYSATRDETRNLFYATGTSDRSASEFQYLHFTLLFFFLSSDVFYR